MLEKVKYVRGGKYKANFLWPHEDGSVEEAGYEFANAGTEEYRKVWWIELRRRIRIHENLTDTEKARLGIKG